MRRIGLEKGLGDLADYLSREGYTVETLDESIVNNTSKFEGLDVIVTADHNTDMMGYGDTKTNIPIVNASGLTPQEVKRMIEQKAVK